MTNSKATKKALFMSMLSLLLCFTMLMGATFAWFTDTVTSSNNKIIAGNLDVELFYQVEGQEDWTPVTETSNIFKEGALWEPGYTEVVRLKAVNEGSLALKYQLGVNVVSEVTSTNVNGGELKLSDHIKYGLVDGDTDYTRDTAIAAVDANATKLAEAYTSDVIELYPKDYTVEGSTETYPQEKVVTLVVYMPTTVDNVANHAKDEPVPEIKLGLNVNATQLAAEEDSFDNKYDEEALYPVGNGVYKDENDNLVVLDMKGLSAVAELATTDKNITSVKYDGEDIPVVHDVAAMNAELAENEDTIVLAEGTYTIGAAAGKDVTLVGNENTKVDVTSGLTYVNGANLTLEGLTIQSAPEGAGYENGLADAQKAVLNNCVINGTLGLDFTTEFNNCVFNIEGNYYNVWTWGAGTATFNGCTFNSEGKALLVYANTLDNGTNHQTVKINNCVFNDNGDDTVTGKAAIEITNTYTPIRTYDVFITNTTVNGFTQTVPGAGDFNATFGSVAGSNIGTNVWGNKMELPNTQINVVIDGVDVY